MWNHQAMPPIEMGPIAPHPRLAEDFAKIIATTPAKGAAAGLYLRQRHLAEADIGEMLAEIAAEELAHEDVLLELMQKLRGDICEGPLPAVTQTEYGAYDLVTALYYDLFLEQTQRTMLSRLLTETDDANVRHPVAWILTQDMRHSRRIAEALRLSLFKIGACDPFQPLADNAGGAPEFSLNGWAEEIEYYHDTETGRYACRSAGKIELHD